MGYHWKNGKLKIRRDEVKVLGYYDTEHTKNVRDWKEVFDFTVQDPTIVPASPHPDDKEVIEWHNQWPEYPPELREACEEYAEELEKLCYKLMELIALSSGLPADRFHGYFKDQTSFIRLIHYPPCPVPDLALGVGRHKDDGALTILAQDDVGGLEVKRKSDGEWIRVKPTPDAFIINVGDIIQETWQEYIQEVEKLAFKLLELISLSLGLPANQLSEFFKHQTGMLRFNYYRPCPFPELALGVGRHRDGGALIVLAQDDVGGLQSKRQSDREWIPVKPIPNAYIINIADTLQVP
ncbi:hypothetical protein REPUB_Repub01dG0179400 [Reevesia pubescens]